MSVVIVVKDTKMITCASVGLNPPASAAAGAGLAGAAARAPKGEADESGAAVPTAAATPSFLSAPAEAPTGEAVAPNGLAAFAPNGLFTAPAETPNGEAAAAAGAAGRAAGCGAGLLRSSSERERGRRRHRAHFRSSP